MDKICDLCGKIVTGRVIRGKAVCDKCFVEGQYNLPDNQAKLAESDATPVKPQAKRPKRR